MTSDDFKRIRTAYSEARSDQRDAIVERLIKKGYNTSTHRWTGRGVPRYTNGGTLVPPHDLTHWLWIDATRPDGLNVRVALQTFDQDSNSRNEHVLTDRLSYGVIPARIENSRWLTDTGLVLPLDDAMLDRLVTLLDELPDLGPVSGAKVNLVRTTSQKPELS